MGQKRSKQAILAPGPAQTGNSKKVPRFWSDPVSPAAQVRAARALLNWSQIDLAKKAHVGISTVADFERGHRVPIHSTTQAMKSALEKAGIAFVPGGVLKGRRRVKR